MVTRQVRIGWGLLVLIVLSQQPAAAASVDLRLTLSATRSAPDFVTVTGRVANTGQVPAFALYAELRKSAPVST